MFLYLKYIVIYVWEIASPWICTRNRRMLAAAPRYSLAAFLNLIDHTFCGPYYALFFPNRGPFMRPLGYVASDVECRANDINYGRRSDGHYGDCDGTCGTDAWGTKTCAWYCE
jgi:hypothetical protein